MRSREEIDTTLATLANDMKDLIAEMSRLFHTGTRLSREDRTIRAEELLATAAALSGLRRLIESFEEGVEEEFRERYRGFREAVMAQRQKGA